MHKGSFNPIPSKSPIDDPQDFPTPSHLSQDIQGGPKSHDTTLLHHLGHRCCRANAKIVFHPLLSLSEAIKPSFGVPWDSRGSKMASAELWRSRKGAYLAPCTRCSTRMADLGKKKWVLKVSKEEILATQLLDYMIFNSEVPIPRSPPLPPSRLRALRFPRLPPSAPPGGRPLLAGIPP